MFRIVFCETKFNDCLKILKEETEKKIKEVFRNHENEKREEIGYEETVQDEYTHKWLKALLFLSKECSKYQYFTQLTSACYENA